MVADDEIRIEPRRTELDPEVERRLIEELASCPDLAFAHLPDVLVPGRQHRPEPVLFAWLEPGALGSLRFALNLVTEAVARALPDREFLDVVVLNSAPELLVTVERAGCLLVERDPEERARALEAAARIDVGGAAGASSGPWWWPF